MFLEIITPEKKIYEGEVSSATFPGSDGSFQVLNNHAPLISSLTKGQVKYIDESGTHELIIESGVVEVLHNEIKLLAEGTVEE